VKSTGREVVFRINGRQVRAPDGSTVAAAMFAEGVSAFHRSPSGLPRGPICAMGVCFECRVTIDQVPHRRACMEICRSDMEVETGG